MPTPVSVRASKILRTQKFVVRPLLEVTATELVSLREHLHLLVPVFAGYLRTNPRTLENWAQGGAKPNAKATLLIRLVKKFHDTVDWLVAV
jgi:putative transcriptional regulator